jgi:hypothetical protein
LKQFVCLAHGAAAEPVGQAYRPGAQSRPQRARGRTSAVFVRAAVPATPPRCRRSAAIVKHFARNMAPPREHDHEDRGVENAVDVSALRHTGREGHSARGQDHGEVDRGEESGEHISGFKRDRKQQRAGQLTCNRLTKATISLGPGRTQRGRIRSRAFLGLSFPLPARLRQLPRL